MKRRIYWKFGLYYFGGLSSLWFWMGVELKIKDFLFFFGFKIKFVNVLVWFLKGEREVFKVCVVVNFNLELR